MSHPSDRDVLVPPGLPIEEVAAWVGHACWAELRFHELLTAWLAEETHDASAARLWSIRSAAASRAEAWHHRLPELREMPRAGFVEPSSPTVERFFTDLARSTRDGDVDRALAAEVVTNALRHGYEARQAVAVGPADEPVARSLRNAIASLPDAPEVHPTTTAPPLP